MHAYIRVGFAVAVAECTDASLVLYLFCFDSFCCCYFFVILITATTTYLIKLTGIKISRDRKCARVKIRLNHNNNSSSTEQGRVGREGEAGKSVKKQQTAATEKEEEEIAAAEKKQSSCQM